MRFYVVVSALYHKAFQKHRGIISGLACLLCLFLIFGIGMASFQLPQEFVNIKRSQNIKASLDANPVAQQIKNWKDSLAQSSSPDNALANTSSSEIDIGAGIYNGKLDQYNVVECSNVDNEKATVKLKVYNNTGKVLGSKSFSISAGASKHIALNSYPISNTYGIYKAFNTTGKARAVKCTTVIYKFSTNQDSIEYAYSQNSLDLLSSESYGSYNSTNPNGNTIPVENWLSLINQSIDTGSFRIELYSTAGKKTKTITVKNLKSKKRTEIALGHITGLVKGSYKIIPLTENSVYSAFLTRYGKSSEGNYKFAFAIPASQGYLDTGPITASTIDSSYNIAEIVNPNNSSLKVSLFLKDSYSNSLYSKTVTLKAHARFELELRKLLGAKKTGYFQAYVASTNTDILPIVVNTSTYQYSAANDIQWAYSTLPWLTGEPLWRKMQTNNNWWQQDSDGTPLASTLIISFPANTNLNSQNWLNLTKKNLISLNSDQLATYVNVSTLKQPKALVVGTSQFNVNKVVGNSRIINIPVSSYSYFPPAGELVRAYKNSDGAVTAVMSVAPIVVPAWAVPRSNTTTATEKAVSTSYSASSSAECDQNRSQTQNYVRDSGWNPGKYSKDDIEQKFQQIRDSNYGMTGDKLLNNCWDRANNALNYYNSFFGTYGDAGLIYSVNINNASMPVPSWMMDATGHSGTTGYWQYHVAVIIPDNNGNAWVCDPTFANVLSPSEWTNNVVTGNGTATIFTASEQNTNPDWVNPALDPSIDYQHQNLSSKSNSLKGLKSQLAGFTCRNGATNAPGCDKCPEGQFFQGGCCVSYCFETSNFSKEDLDRGIECNRFGDISYYKISSNKCLSYSRSEWNLESGIIPLELKYERDIGECQYEGISTQNNATMPNKEYCQVKDIDLSFMRTISAESCKEYRDYQTAKEDVEYFAQKSDARADAAPEDSAAYEAFVANLRQPLTEAENRLDAKQDACEAENFEYFKLCLPWIITSCPFSSDYFATLSPYCEAEEQKSVDREKAIFEAKIEYAIALREQNRAEKIYLSCKNFSSSSTCTQCYECPKTMVGFISNLYASYVSKYAAAKSAYDAKVTSCQKEYGSAMPSSSTTSGYSLRMAVAKAINSLEAKKVLCGAQTDTNCQYSDEQANLDTANKALAAFDCIKEAKEALDNADRELSDFNANTASN